MAYFSDTQDTPAKRGLWCRRRTTTNAADAPGWRNWCRVAQSRGIPRYTGFLSDREQSLAQAACNKAGCDCIRFWGGFEGAERKVLCIEPPDAWQEEPLAYLQFAAYGDKAPTHRDYLGSILGLGLERTCVGDLLADPERDDTFYAVVLADQAGVHQRRTDQRRALHRAHRMR